jgi:hypothetical protein
MYFCVLFDINDQLKYVKALIFVLLEEFIMADQVAQANRVAGYEQRLTALKARRKVLDHSFSNTWIIDSITTMCAVEAFSEKDDDSLMDKMVLQTVLAAHVIYRLYVKYGHSDSFQNITLHKPDSKIVVDNGGYEAYLDSLPAWFAEVEEDIVQAEKQADMFSLTRPLCLWANTFFTFKIGPAAALANIAVSTGAAVNYFTGNKLKLH